MKKGVFHNSVLTLIRQVLSIGFGLLATMIIARVLGAEGPRGSIDQVYR